jgi:hypothetical protein
VRYRSGKPTDVVFAARTGDEANAERRCFRTKAVEQTTRPDNWDAFGDRRPKAFCRSRHQFSKQWWRCTAIFRYVCFEFGGRQRGHGVVVACDDRHPFKTAGSAGVSRLLAHKMRRGGRLIWGSVAAR